MTDNSFAQRVRAAFDALQAEAKVARRTIAAQEQPRLDFFLRLIATIRVALEEKDGRLPGSGWRVAAVALFIKVISTLQAAHTLSTAGHALEVGILVRSALEAFITATFIAKEDSDLRARRWAEYAELQKAKVLKKYPKLSRTPEHQQIAAEILERVHEIEEHFPNRAFWASGLGQGSVRDLAEAVDMGWYYDFIYWSGSQAVHSSAIAVGSYVEIAGDGNARYKMGFSSKHLRGELAACCDVLTRTLEGLNDLCQLGTEKIAGELVAEYKAAFGDDDPLNAGEAPLASN